MGNTLAYMICLVNHDMINIIMVCVIVNNINQRHLHRFIDADIIQIV
jgi:hypothetical protein